MLLRKLKELQSTSPFIGEIISPLKPLGIDGFFYARIYDNGEFIDLTSNPQFAESYFKKFFSGEYTTEVISDHLFIEQGVSLWELNPHNRMYQDAKNIYSYGDGITIFENNHTHHYKESYSFYSMTPQIEMNNFFLLNLDFLRKFKAYFLEKAEPLIEEAKQNKYLLPELYRKIETVSINQEADQLLSALKINLYSKTPLAPRELQCLSLLSQGNSAKEIAHKLKLSPSTVENYIANAKTKWQCRKSSELINFAMKMNLF